MNTEQKHNKCQILLVIIIYYSFFFLRGLPGFNIEVALSLVSFPVQALSWVLAKRRWEWWVILSLETRQFYVHE